MSVSLKDLRGKVKRPIRTVRVCLDGDLWAQYDEVNARFESASGDDAKRLAKELRAIEDAMREAEVAIDFRGISSFQLAEIQARFPDKNGRGWDVDAGSAALISACAVDPVSEEDVQEVLNEVNFAVSNLLFKAAWDATTGSTAVPFSARASALINASA